MIEHGSVVRLRAEHDQLSVDLDTDAVTDGYSAANAPGEATPKSRRCLACAPGASILTGRSFLVMCNVQPQASIEQQLVVGVVSDLAPTNRGDVMDDQ